MYISIFFIINKAPPVGAVVKDIVIGAVGLELDSQSGQFGHSVTTATTFLWSCAALTLSR